MYTVSGLVRTMAASPRVHLANPKKNAEEIADLLRQADEQSVQLCVFPELCLTGATCGDLYAQSALLRGAEEALRTLAALPVRTAFVVGLPLSIAGRLYSCAAFVCGGKLAILPKARPDRSERLFAPGDEAPPSMTLFGQSIPVGTDLLLDLGGFTLSIAQGDAPPPSTDALLLALSCAASAAWGSRKACLRALTQRSLQNICACLYAGAGYGESTTDLVFSGHACIAEDGALLAENERFARASSFTLADVDVERLRFQRIRRPAPPASPARIVPFNMPSRANIPLVRTLKKLPFVPDDPQDLRDILMIMTQGLITRMAHIGLKKVVLGVSGGLDSTLTLLAAAHAFDLAGWDRQNIIGITMPGLGTGSRTRTNADKLMEQIGCTRLEIPIGPAVAQHFADIGQDPHVHDVCFENSQARERTQIVMDYANKIGALALGTGDLSELALGFCTYNGDHMSMYNMSASVPKTLVRRLARWTAESLGVSVAAIVADVLDTPISPELIPAGEGELTQRTEDTLGDYALHDFFLFHMMDSGASPARLHALACAAFRDQYAPDVILKTLRTFIRRFFAQQFKRSALPDGPAVGPVSLSPRGAWVMPSDAQAQLWLEEVEAIRGD